MNKNTPITKDNKNLKGYLQEAKSNPKDPQAKHYILQPYTNN